MQAKHGAHLLGAAQLERALTAPLLDPAKHLLDTAAGIDRLAVALMAGGAAIDCGATGAGGVLCHVRCDADTPHLIHETLGVEVLVGSKGFLVGTGTISRLRLGGIPLTGARAWSIRSVPMGLVKPSWTHFSWRESGPLSPFPSFPSQQQQQGLLEVCPSRARRHGLITVGCAGTAPLRCHPTLPIRLPPPI